MADNKGGMDDDVILFVLITGAIVGIGWLLWTNFTLQITDIIRNIRIFEMSIAQYFLPEKFGVQYATMREPVFFKSMQEFLQNAKTSEITPQHIMISSDLALQGLRVPIAVSMFIMAGLIVLWGPHTKFKRRHSIETLMQRQAKAFPYITPMLDFDPSKMPPRAPGDPVPEQLPLFAEALSPEEWVAYHRLPMPEGKLDVEATAAALAKQLGPRWRGWQKCPAYIQILLASFCLRALRKRDESDAMLGRLAICWNHKKGLSLAKDARLLGEARTILRSKQADGMHKAMRQHAFMTTAVVRALDYTRSEGGVLSPGQFVWLRGHDRDLWYPLNNLGRQAYHLEAIGAMAHFKLEKLTQRPVPAPKMDSAVIALKGYFDSGQARPIPPMAYTKKSSTSGSKQGRKAGIMKPAA